MNPRNEQNREGNGGDRANDASSYVDSPPINDRFTGTSNSVCSGTPVPNNARHSWYRGPWCQGPSLAERQIREWQRHPDLFELSRREAGMMLCTFFFGLAIPTENSVPVLLLVLVGTMWSQRKTFDALCWQRRFDEGVRQHSDVYGVTSVLYVDQDIIDHTVAVNAASTEPTVEHSVVDSGIDNKMFGVNSFVELGDMDMRISVGGPMSDWFVNTAEQVVLQGWKVDSKCII